MLRLRTTMVLSTLALMVAVGGTYWLSGRSTDEPLMMPWVTAVKRSPPPRHRTVSPASRAYAFDDDRALADASRRRRSRTDEASAITAPHGGAAEQAAPVAPPPELVPLDMPSSRDLAYEKLRGHLDGRVTMHVSVDGQGHVIAASVAQSSGDAVLDAHALRSVRGWRFAVPPDHPDGLSGDLPMRFSSHEEPVASVP